MLNRFKSEQRSNRNATLQRSNVAARTVTVPMYHVKALAMAGSAFAIVNPWRSSQTASTKIHDVRFGLTLIELIAALALSAVLFATTMGLATRIANHQSRLTEEFKYQPWKLRVERLLEDDFRNCRTFLVDESRSTISMVTCHSVQGYKKRQQPALVNYQVETHNNENYLIRTELPLSGNPTRQSDRLVVCTGVRGIRSLTRIDSDYPSNAVVLELVSLEESRWLVNLVRHGGK